jgi:hypothetical protein
MWKGEGILNNGKEIELGTGPTLKLCIIFNYIRLFGSICILCLLFGNICRLSYIRMFGTVGSENYCVCSDWWFSMVDSYGTS